MMTGLIQLRAPRKWIAAVDRSARRAGLSLSAYLRQAASERMRREGRHKDRRQK